MKLSPKYILVFFIPLLALMLIYELLSISMYLRSFTSFKSYFYIWILAQAIGNIFSGYIADKISKKQALLLSQCLGIIFVIFLSKLELIPNYLLIILTILLGILFTPIPMIRASIVNNYPHHSKVQLIAITCLFQFIPWCFFNTISALGEASLMKIIVSLISINVMLTLLFFKDRHDLMPTASQNAFSNHIIHQDKKTLVVLTLFSLFFAESVFFISDSFVGITLKSPKFFSLIGAGCAMGSIMSFFYRKTPHAASITISYGFGFIFSLLTLMAIQYFPDMETTLFSMLVIFIASIGGFYLPFVYDIVLSCSSSRYRSTSCGIIETLISVSALFSLFLDRLLIFSKKGSLLVILILFFLAYLIQKISENHYSHKTLFKRERGHLLSPITLKKKRN